MTPDLAVFSIFALMSIVTGVAVLASRRAIMSALALVLNFFVLSLFYFTLGSQLLGIVQIFVYLGAIMVLFLFCIMLLRLGQEDHLTEKGYIKLGAAAFLSLTFFGLLFVNVIKPFGTTSGESPESLQLHQQASSIEAVGHGLFTRWAFPFEVTSLLLLVGIVGSILLAKRRI